MTFAIGVLGSFLVYIVVGVLVGRRVRDDTDYYVAGRRAPVLLITGSLVASYLSTVFFLGELGFAYSGYPLVLLTLNCIQVTGYVLGAMFFGRYIRRSQSLTVPEFFGKRFNSRAMQVVAGGTVVLGLGAYLLAVTQGVGIVLSNLIGVDLWIALLVTWIGYAAFTFFAGSPGVLTTDTIMFFVLGLAAVVGMSYLVTEAGGPSAVLSGLSTVEGKQEIMLWQGPTGPDADFGTPVAAVFWGILFGVVWAVVAATSPWQTSRYLMARTEHTLIRASLLAMGAVLIIYVFAALGGAAINVFNPGISPNEAAFIWTTQNVFPAWLGVLAITGIVAGGLSSASTFLSLIGFSAARDVWTVLFRGNRDQQSPQGTALRFSRTVMLAVSLVVLVVAYVAPPAVFEIGYFAATLFAASWGPLAFLSVYSRRITTRGAITGICTGFITVFVLQALVTFGGLELPVYLHPMILGTAASLLSIFAANVGREPNTEGLEFRQSLFSVPSEERQPSRLKGTLRYTYLTVAVSASVIVFLLFVYVLPYAQTIAASE
jgi:Na+/proline symporter